MTTSEERLNSIKWMGDFVCRLMREEPRIPRKVREEARRRLRHYPTHVEVDIYFRHK